MQLSLYLYLLLAIYVIFSKKKALSIIGCIFFGIFIFISRDINAAPDSIHYLNFFVKDIRGLGSSKTFLFYQYGLKNILLLPGIIAYHLTTFIPFFVISYISIRSKIVLPIFFFVSSEAFAVLSFNAMRQGLAISFFLIIIYFYKYIFNLEFFKNKSQFELIFILALSIAASLHSTLFGFILLILGFITLNYFSELLIDFFKKLIISKKSFLIVFTTISGSLFFVYLTILSKIPFLAKATFYLTNNETYNSGTLGSFYRLTVMIFLILYPYLRKYNYSIKNIIKNLRTDNFVFYSFISILSLATIAPFGAQLFIRFSYFYIIPITFNFLNWKERDPYIVNNSTITKLFIVLVGLITYSSGAIENILYK